MGSHRERPPLLIRPGFSRRFALFVGLTHVSAALAVLTLPFGPISLVLLPLIAVSGLYVLVVDVLGRASWSIRTVIWQADGTWQIHFVSGAQREATLATATFVSLPLVVLNFRLGALRRRALPVFADALDREQLRRLRRQLRIEGATGNQDADPNAG